MSKTYKSSDYSSKKVNEELRRCKGGVFGQKKERKNKKVVIMREILGEQ